MDEDARMKAAKAALRSQVAERLGGLSRAEVAAQSASLARQLLGGAAWRESRSVCLYLSPEPPSRLVEADTWPLLSQAFAAGKAVFVPRFSPGRQGRMEMLRLGSAQEAAALPRTWGIRQPAPDDHRDALDSVGGAELAVVPGLAFTAAGQRLGRGRGYYDRWLSWHRRRFGRLPRTVALALREQVVSDLPTDQHDVPVDSVLVAD